jgi:hypothetical protein
VEAVIADTDYVELLAAYHPAKPHNRQELAEMTVLLESLSANETAQTPAMERFAYSGDVNGRFRRDVNKVGACDAGTCNNA